MKRILLLFFSVVLCLGMIAVPAFASEQITLVDIVDGWLILSDVPAPGEWVLEFTFNTDEGVYKSTPDPIYIGEFGPLDDDGTLGYITEPFIVASSAYEEVYFSLAVALNENDGSPVCMAFFMDDLGNFDNNRVVTFTLSKYDVVLPPVQYPEVETAGIMYYLVAIGDWIASSVSSFTSLFWDAGAGSLTLLGYVLIAGFAFAAVFLLIHFIKRCLGFRS